MGFVSDVELLSHDSGVSERLEGAEAARGKLGTRLVSPCRSPSATAPARDHDVATPSSPVFVEFPCRVRGQEQHCVCKKLPQVSVFSQGWSDCAEGLE